ncbi:DNA-binding SARP family transcriptional activator [Kitasatospora sp. MAA19]|uniref:AfsR/SARP family transcriptional regulator n=1 Tax=Kitasatospora sp. MAA19 TaxID=3035090 RepID=UPI002476D6EA|nr:BTAD domain-containing putative transcriptional regulator [Kitasatospora sp. MAA19]MDH6707811.1 DNA-binding SARP family transcriptional activator [Kitasatospora sp. MAA19]
MGIRLLGPVELRHGTGADDGTDSAVPVGSAQRRAVLALLALELGRTVAVGQLLELLWAERPPTRAKAALQGHVATLRRLLDGSGLAITTSAPGYRLTGHPEAVDALHAEALAARAAATDDDTTAAALLERALRLWRGAALADLPATPLAAALAARLDDTRTELLTAWTRCLLRLGRGHAAVPALEQSVRADGLREPTAALLVRCLHQSGRGADAVRLHRQATARLDEELGVGPGPELRAALAELTEAGEALTDGAPTIRHFPSAPDGFVGREAEERWLDHHGRAEQGGGGLAVVVGPAGVGKSATVLRWAHRAAAGFPDGRLFADLRGFDPAGPADPAQILGRFLRSLGLPEQAVPEGLAARADLFRALTRRRRLLVVLDNVRTAAEATELLPAGPACVTVLTSRNTLEELVVTDGAALLHIDALPASDAHRLLEHRLTAERVAAEPAAAARLIELCDRLPLALQITADRLAARPGWKLASLVDELADERTRLTALRTDGGAVSVRTALSRTYPHLPGPARRLLALLTAHPGTTTDVSAAAALLAADAETARHALGSLAAHHLLTEPAPGRYGRHDLVRLYGAELFDGLPAERRDTAFQRLADYELAAGGHAVQRTNPHYRPYRPPGPGPQALPRLSDVRATLDWCRAEEPVLRALVTAAAERGDHERAWRLAEVTAVLYYGADRVVDRLSCLRAGLHAARLDGGREGLAAMEAATACALGTVGYVAEALPLAARAVDRTTPEDGDRHIHALSVLSSMTALSGDPAEADRISRAALALVRSSGLRQHAATILSNAAAIKLSLGDPAAALAHARETHTLLPHRPSANAAIWAVVSEALAHQSLGDRDRAELAWHDALHRCRSTGNVRLHALAHRQFAEFLTVGGRSAEAATHHHAAAELYTAHGDAPRAEHLDRQLVEPARRTAPR